MSAQSAIALRRLAAQQLVNPQFDTPEAVVGWLGAMQGQDYAGAKWAVGVRLPGSTDATVEQALDERRIVRTWALRGTLQLVAASDVRWLLELVGPHVIARNAHRYRQLELDQATLTRSNDLLARVVADNKGLDRRTLFARLEQSGISTAGQRGVYMLQRASLDRLICQGAAPRNNAVFIALDECAPSAPGMTREQALAELASRYWSSRGPATLDDFVWWSGLPVSEARTALNSIQSNLVEEQAEPRFYWSLSAPRIRLRRVAARHTPDVARASRNSCFLLPGFDEYLLGYRDRSASLDTPHYNRRTPTNGMLPSTVVRGGKVIATWKHTLEKGTVTISLEPFGTLDAAATRAIARAENRYGQFLGLKVKVK